MVEIDEITPKQKLKNFMNEVGKLQTYDNAYRKRQTSENGGNLLSQIKNLESISEQLDDLVGNKEYTKGLQVFLRLKAKYDENKPKSTVQTKEVGTPPYLKNEQTLTDYLDAAFKKIEASGGKCPFYLLIGDTPKDVSHKGYGSLKDLLGDVKKIKGEMAVVQKPIGENKEHPYIAFTIEGLEKEFESISKIPVAKEIINNIPIGEGFYIYSVEGGKCASKGFKTATEVLKQGKTQVFQRIGLDYIVQVSLEALKAVAATEKVDMAEPASEQEDKDEQVTEMSMEGLLAKWKSKEYKSLYGRVKVEGGGVKTMAIDNLSSIGVMMEPLPEGKDGIVYLDENGNYQITVDHCLINTLIRKYNEKERANGQKATTGNGENRSATISTKISPGNLSMAKEMVAIVKTSR